ncbi:MAG: dienelactone hydrolase family protein [Acidimicrobiales bacterium]
MRITLPSGTPAELARPAGEARRGLVIVPDIGGMRPLFDDMASRLAAEQGWAVCVVEPWPGREDMPVPDRLDAVNTIADTDLLGDLQAAAAELGTEPVAVLGFCMGGMYSLKAAGMGVFDKAVSFYGMIHVPDNWQGPDHGEPIDAVRSDGASQVLAIIGTVDQWTPVDHVDELEATGATVVRYDGADHGFVHDPSRPAHRPDDAADAWTRVYDFLAD